MTQLPRDIEARIKETPDLDRYSRKLLVNAMYGAGFFRQSGKTNSVLATYNHIKNLCDKPCGDNKNRFFWRLGNRWMAHCLVCESEWRIGHMQTLALEVQLKAGEFDMIHMGDLIWNGHLIGRWHIKGDDWDKLDNPQ